MKEVTITSWDDLDAADGKRTEATSTIVLAYNGTEVELDLGEANRKALENDLRPILAAGRKPDRTAGARRQPYQRSAPASYRQGSGKARKQELREWAKARGREAEYTTPGGNLSYRLSLRQDYNKWLIEQGREDEATF
jgi:hypothetical protein